MPFWGTFSSASYLIFKFVLFDPSKQLPLDVKVETCGCTSQYRSPARELQRFRRCAGSRVLRQLLAGSQIDFLKMDGRYEGFFCEQLFFSFERSNKRRMKKAIEMEKGIPMHPHLAKVSPSTTWFSSATRPRSSLLARQSALVFFKKKSSFCKPKKSPPVADVSTMIMKPWWFMVISNDLFIFITIPGFKRHPYFTCTYFFNPPPRNLPWLHRGPEVWPFADLPFDATTLVGTGACDQMWHYSSGCQAWESHALQSQILGAKLSDLKNDQKTQKLAFC